MGKKYKFILTLPDDIETDSEEEIEEYDLSVIIPSSTTIIKEGNYWHYALNGLSVKW